MKISLLALLMAATLGAGSALADNPPTNDQMTGNKPALTSDQQKFMQECMTKARAANAGLSEHEMKKGCMNQLKTGMGNSDDSAAPAH
jgi:hypothetical protein